MRASLETAAKSAIDPVWVEELVLQTYLFAGFPRTLNAMREWRRVATGARRRATSRSRSARSGPRAGRKPAPSVYGVLRAAAREHPHAAPGPRRVDDLRGTGKVLGRPGLDLQAAGAVHRRGVRGAGAGPSAALASPRRAQRGGDAGGGGRHLRIVAPRLGANSRHRYALLWARVRRA